MQTDDTDGFRELMLRMTGDLDISQALLKSFVPFRALMPIDEIILFRIEFEHGDIGGVRAIVRVNEDGVVGEPDALLLAFDDEQKEHVQKRSVEGFPEVSIDIRDELSESIRPATFAKLGLPEKSSTLTVLHKAVFGGLLIISYRPDVYNETHIRLFEALKEGIFIMISNAMRFLTLKRAQEHLAEDNRQLQAELYRDNPVVGAARGLKTCMTMVRQVAKAQTPVLLLGETGTGKEVIAQALHRASDRSAGPMISVNCGAIPESLVDSELFGHEKGAYTGAVAASRGRFERANGGTLFLDEIGELPLSAQVRLLRVLQTRELERVGGNQPIRVNVRLIAATHRNLAEMIAKGQFREDLWFRLNVFPISIPPLRERKDDIPLLAYHFIEAKTREMNLGLRPSLHESEMERLVAYDWPGNVRELQNAIERAIILSRGGPLSFPFLTTTDRALTAAPTGSPAAPPGGTRLPTFDDAARAYLAQTLERAHGRISGAGGAAELAGMNPSTFRSKLKKLKVHAPVQRLAARLPEPR